MRTGLLLRPSRTRNLGVGAFPAPSAGVGWHLFRGFVHADLGTVRIVGASVDLEHILHAPHKFGVSLGRDAPLFVEVRLQGVFLRVLLTLW